MMPWQERAKARKEESKDNSSRALHERTDEIIARDAITEYCRSDLSVIPKVSLNETIQSTKPDYIFYFDDAVIVVEITQSGSGFIISPKKITKRAENELPVMRWADNLQESIAAWVVPGQTIVFLINKKLFEYNTKLINEINQKLKSEFENQVDTEEKAIVVKSQSFSAFSTSYYKNFPTEYSLLKLIYGPSLSSPQPISENSLIAQAAFNLEQCISGKEKKYSSVTERKWLAILNTHPLLTQEEYQKAFTKLKENKNRPEHTFERIFIIHRNKAYLLS